MTHISSSKSGSIFSWLCVFILFGLLVECGAPKPKADETRKATNATDNATTDSANKKKLAEVARIESAVENDFAKLKSFVDSMPDSEEKTLVEKLISIHEQINQLRKEVELDPEQMKAKVKEVRGLVAKVAQLHKDLYTPNSQHTPQPSPKGNQGGQKVASFRDLYESLREFRFGRDKLKTDSNKEKARKLIAGLIGMADKVLSQLENGMHVFSRELQSNGVTAIFITNFVFTFVSRIVVCGPDAIAKLALQFGKTVKTLNRKSLRSKSAIQATWEENYQELLEWCEEDEDAVPDWILDMMPRDRAHS